VVTRSAPSLKESASGVEKRMHGLQAYAEEIKRTMEQKKGPLGGNHQGNESLRRRKKGKKSFQVDRLNFSTETDPKKKGAEERELAL